MTQIVGTLKSSTGVAISCIIRATLDQRVIDETTSPDTLYTPVSGTFTVTGGIINFVLPESQTSGVTYLFEYLDTVTLEPYPGLDSFRAIVPNVASVEWTDLQASGLATDVIDTSIAGVVRKLLVSPNFWQAAQDYIFPYRGEWSNLSFYERGDVVSFNGSTYHYTHNVSLAGEVPDTSPYWRLWAQKGDTGTGTGGNDATYDPIAWDGQTDAPSRNAVRDIIEQLPRSSDEVYGATWDGSLSVPTRNAVFDIVQQLARTTDLANYAPLVSPALGGNPSVPDPNTADDNTSRIPNTRWTNSRITTLIQPYALLSGATFTGPVSVPNNSLEAGRKRTYSNTAPTSPIAGDLWYHTDLHTWLYYSGTRTRWETVNLNHGSLATRQSYAQGTGTTDTEFTAISSASFIGYFISSVRLGARSSAAGVSGNAWVISLMNLTDTTATIASFDTVGFAASTWSTRVASAAGSYTTASVGRISMRIQSVGASGNLDGATLVFAYRFYL